MQKAVRELLKMNIKTKDGLAVAKRRLAKKYGIEIMKNADILSDLKKIKNEASFNKTGFLSDVLRKRAIRTLSGVAPIAVLTKPYPCPGRCVYCPSEKDVPQSYLSNEPAVMRAIRCDYNPYAQVRARLASLIANGHKPEKIELIVIGGTWSVLPPAYKTWFIANLFAAANEFKTKKPKSKIQNCSSKLKISELIKILKKEQKINEKTKYKIVGLTLETRPDYIDKKELLSMRELGGTRVELGVQAVDDKILKINKRGHGVDEIARATKLLKDFGFKATYHLMPGLPGSTPAKDLKMFKRLFEDERFQPDQIKFYPTVVTKGSLLFKWWKAGKYKPYSDKSLKNLIIACKEAIPPYVRIIRLIRDIPGESIAAGNRITNLRQIMQNKGIKCRCIRCREAKNRKLNIKNLKFKIIKYQASGGEEYFLSYTDKSEMVLYGFCRLRLVSPGQPASGSAFFYPAIIRELHVYGELVPLKGHKKVQHSGLGKRLMAQAEETARLKGYEKIAVIAGVGVRDYYRKLGYKLEKTYMVKKIK